MNEEKKNMRILAILTSRHIMSVAFVDSEGFIGGYSLNLARSEHTHETVLFPSIQRIASECNIKFSDLFAIAVSCGPGAFTSLRIGITAAKALAYSMGISVIPVNTLDAHAYCFPPTLGSDICVVLQSRRNEVFTATYRWENGELIVVHGCSVSAPENVIKNLKEGTIICGDAVSLYMNVFIQDKSLVILREHACGMLTARTIGYCGLALARKGRLCDPASVSPIYLRPALDS